MAARSFHTSKKSNQTKRKRLSMSHRYEVDIIREEEVEAVATAVFRSLDEAKHYINGHGQNNDLKFKVYELVSGTRVLI
jgi:hypothetical protein